MNSLTDYIIKSSLTNSDDKGITQRKLQTNDYVFIPSVEEEKSYVTKFTKSASTSYAEYNGSLATNHDLNYKIKPTGCHWLRAGQEEGFISYVGFGGNELLTSEFVDTAYIGIRPKIRLELIAVKRLNLLLTSNTFEGEQVYTLSFGSFPQSYVNDEMNEKLFTLFNEGKLNKTGKVYTGQLQDKEFIYHAEYEYEGEKFVLTKLNNYDNNIYQQGEIYKTSNGYATNAEYDKVKPNEHRWVKVEPIKWIVENYKSLPKFINENGDGSAKYIDLTSEDILLGGIPYNASREDKNRTLWKFSIVRAYLNGLDMYKDKHDSALSFFYNFSTNNFITQAFN